MEIQLKFKIKLSIMKHQPTMLKKRLWLFLVTGRYPQVSSDDVKKDQRDNNNEAHEKMAIDISMNDEVDPRSVMGLPDLPLREILKSLNIRDLLKLVDFNISLREFAKLDSQFGTRKLRSQMQLSPSKNLCYIRLHRDRVEICGLEFILKFLRIFIVDINSLNINYEGSFEENALLVRRYANQYLPNLITLILDNALYRLSRDLVDHSHPSNLLPFKIVLFAPIFAACRNGFQMWKKLPFIRKLNLKLHHDFFALIINCKVVSISSMCD